MNRYSRWFSLRWAFSWRSRCSMCISDLLQHTKCLPGWDACSFVFFLVFFWWDLHSIKLRSKTKMKQDSIQRTFLPTFPKSVGIISICPGQWTIINSLLFLLWNGILSFNPWTTCVSIVLMKFWKTKVILKAASSSLCKRGNIAESIKTENHLHCFLRQEKTIEHPNETFNTFLVS